MSQPVRIPADVDREDRVIGPLTARQLLILAVTGMLLYAACTASPATLVPLAGVPDPGHSRRGRPPRSWRWASATASPWTVSCSPRCASG